MDIKPTLDMLIELADAYRPEAPYFVCLNREKRMAIIATSELQDAARERLGKLEADPEKAREGHRLDQPDPIDAAKSALADAENAHAKAIEDALPQSVALIFGSLPATDISRREGEEWSYEGLLSAMRDDSGDVDSDAFADRLLALCYLRTEGPDGQDLGRPWVTAARFADMSDWKNLRRMIIGHHIVGAAIPFDPRTSGQSATT